MRTCDICDKKHYAMGYCEVHWRQYRGEWTGVCYAEGCELRVHAKGLCCKHYTRMRRHGVLELPEGTKEKPWWCVYGHDKNVFGVYNRGQCKECDRIRKHYRNKPERYTERSQKRMIPLRSLEGARKQLGVSRTDVARKSGLTRGFIGSLERGDRCATPWVQKRVVQAIVDLKKERSHERRSL